MKHAYILSFSFTDDMRYIYHLHKIYYQCRQIGHATILAIIGTAKVTPCFKQVTETHPSPLDSTYWHLIYKWV